MELDPSVVTISAITPAVILGVTGWYKVTSQQSFRDLLENYNLTPSSWVTYLAVILPSFELVAACALMFPGGRRFGALCALAILVLFTSALGLALWRGQYGVDCGCSLSQGTHTPLSPAVLVRNVMLMLWLIPASAAAKLTNRPLVWLDWVSIVVATATGVLAYAICGDLLANQRRASRRV